MSEGTVRRPDPRQWSFAGGYQLKSDNQTRSCGCVGPQNGQPKCPCMMQSLKQVNGRWVEMIDHGPVRNSVEEAAIKFFETRK